MDSDLRVRKSFSYRGAAGAFALAICLSTLGLADQDQREEPTGRGQEATSEPSPTGGAPEAPQEPAALPSKLTVPSGTIITVRVSQLLSSDHNQAGDSFHAELQQPVVVDGWVVSRRGQTVLGRVAVAQKAGRVKGVSQLGVELSYLVFVDGQQMPARTQLLETSAGSSKGRDAQAIAGTTGLGAAIGAAAHGGEGAGIGAAVGAVAGIAGVLLARGRPTVIPPETVLTFQLQSPISISTQRSRPAFRPVNQEDYDGGALRRRLQHFAAAPYPLPPYYWGYPWGYYPGSLYLGFYGYGRFGRGRRW